jgi:hypothetical protein
MVGRDERVAWSAAGRVAASKRASGRASELEIRRESR